MSAEKHGKAIELEELKQIELEILKYLDEVCRRNGIRYSLDYGTLLGAVRHKGFIPWDDDVDVLLLRPEYEKLVSILEKEDKYLLLKPETKDYWLPFAKLIDRRTYMVMHNRHEIKIPDLGVYIDIFPVDGCPRGREEQAAFQKKLMRELLDIRTSFGCSYYNTGTPWKNVVKCILYFPVFLYYRLSVPPEKRKEKLLKDMQTYPVESSDEAAFLFFGYGTEVMPKSWFFDVEDMDFEGCRFMAMRRYDEYLTAIYGDYMTPPPPEERVTEHQYSAYYK